jgi:hypothetical protein
MSAHPKSAFYILMITGFLFILLTGCKFWHGKPDAVIEVDLTKPGKVFLPDRYHLLEDTTGTNIGSNLKIALELATKLIALENHPVEGNVISQKRYPDSVHSNSYFSPSFYAVKLFSDNRPDKVMPLIITMRTPNTIIHATAGIQEKAGLVILKMVNPNKTTLNCRIALKYYLKIKYKGEVTVMTSISNMDENSTKYPERVVPMTKELNGLTNTFNYECPANSVVLIKVRYRKGINGFGNCC